MKKIASMTLALLLCLGMVSCGDSKSSSSSKASKSDSSSAAGTAAGTEDEPAEDVTTTTTAATEAEPEVPLNTNVVHKDFSNTVANISASFDVANIDGFDTTEVEQNQDFYRADGRFGYMDPDWYSNAITIDYIVQPVSAYYIEMLEEKKEVFDNYDKTDLGCDNLLTVMSDLIPANSINRSKT